MKDLKIRVKLTLVVTISAIFLVALGLCSIFFMKAINNASSDINDISVPAITISEELNSGISEHRRYELAHIISSDDNMMATYETNIENCAANMTKLFDSYLEYTTTQEDVNLLNTARNGWNTYRSYTERILIASRAGRTQEAMNIAIGESKTMFDNIVGSFAEIVDYNQSEVERFNRESNNSFRTAVTGMIIAVILMCTILTFISIKVLHLVLEPVKELDEVFRKIAEGNLSEEISYQSKDELGDLAKNFNLTVSRLRTYIDYINEITNVLNQIAVGNLDFYLTLDYTGDFAKVKSALENISDSLNDTLYQINNSSDEVASGSEQVSMGSQALSQGATEQASAIEELVATINDISHQIKESAEHAEEAREQNVTSHEELVDCGNQMKDLVQAMEVINGKAREINNIIKTIEDIAFQTNILALNAAVEAARAGSAGKGFAVVADEVRNLAAKSADAAKDTTTLIEETIKAVADGNRISTETEASLNTAVDSARAVLTSVTNIAEAANREAAAINQVTQGMEQISSVVQTNSATAEESAAASEELSGQAQILKDLVARFKLKGRSDGFVSANTSKPQAVKKASVTKVSSNLSFDDVSYSDKY